MYLYTRKFYYHSTTRKIGFLGTSKFAFLGVRAFDTPAWLRSRPPAVSLRSIYLPDAYLLNQNAHKLPVKRSVTLNNTIVTRLMGHLFGGLTRRDPSRSNTATQRLPSCCPAGLGSGAEGPLSMIAWTRGPGRPGNRHPASPTQHPHVPESWQAAAAAALCGLLRGLHAYQRRPPRL